MPITHTGKYIQPKYMEIYFHPPKMYLVLTSASVAMLKLHYYKLSKLKNNEYFSIDY